MKTELQKQEKYRLHEELSRASSVIDTINRPKYKLLRLRNRFLLSRRKRKILEGFSWYRTATGKWVHPHQLDYMSWWEIRKLSPAQLEYKLRHGSQANLPERLKNRKGD